MSDWNVSLYQKFASERQQPVFDLIHRLPTDNVHTIIDVGCGSGLSTLPLKSAYHNAAITGIDFSKSMLADAYKKDSSIRWFNRDCNEPLNDLGQYDLVFSNATLQWLKDQAKSIGYMASLVRTGGTMALQIPYFMHLPIQRCVEDVVNSYPASTFSHLQGTAVFCYSPAYYYNQFAQYFSKIELWQTNYFHIMDSHQELLDFYRGTALRTYLNELTQEAQSNFLHQILTAIKAAYKEQPNGSILFEFDRIFIVAHK